MIPAESHSDFIARYDAFLRAKVKIATPKGFPTCELAINQALKDHQKVGARWLVEGGTRALFYAFGLGKTVIQLEAVRLTLANAGGRGLIVCPLGVRQEFTQDAMRVLKWETAPKFIRSIEEADATGIYLTNYETVRDGKLDPAHFVCVSLDECGVMRGGGSSKTFREFMRLFTGDAGCMGERRNAERVKYRFVATATPSPNDYIELLVYADFLGIMQISEAKTRFFKRDSTQADKLTLHPHKEREFWLWVASWALFCQKPSDLDPSFSDVGYDLPPITVNWHEVETDHSKAGYDRGGQGKLLRDAAIGITDAAAEKRNSLPKRLEKLMSLRAEDPSAHRIIWHDLEAEREAIEAAIPDIVTVRGSDSDDHKIESITGFANGSIQEIGGKPVMLGAGVNWQRHCSWAIYFGIGFKFYAFIQSIHRIARFLQTKPVRIDIIHSEAERSVKQSLVRKWKQHDHMVKRMSEIIREFGLSHAAMAQSLTRRLGVDRVEIIGERYRCVNNDSIKEMQSVAHNSIGLILTSIPFADQYEYSPNYADLGHSDGNEEFFEQMEFLTPQLYDRLMPGRLCCIHVKDRVVPCGLSQMGFQTVYPFHARCIEHFSVCPSCRERRLTDKKHICTHRFGYMGMKTIVTDVVRENNQTYRLGWSEQTKDGSKMGVGMPEYLLIFRKPPTDRSNSYADLPVKKSKQAYSLARWQVDAHGFARSSGNRGLTPEEIAGLSHKEIYRLFKRQSLTEVYDFEHHVIIGDAVAAKGKLPVTFMLLQPQSWSDEVWTDITRMRTSNMTQAAKGKEMHLCPMQWDLADRAIEQWSLPGETVLDPFGGLMSVPYRAILKGRKAIGIELSAPYFLDGATYCKAAEESVSMPSLFDIMETEESDPLPPELSHAA